MDGSGSNITLVGLLADGLVMEEEGGRDGRPALIKKIIRVTDRFTRNDK